jgi:hypothetical protein
VGGKWCLVPGGDYGGGGWTGGGAEGAAGGGQGPGRPKPGVYLQIFGSRLLIAIRIRRVYENIRGHYVKHRIAISI